MVCSLLSPPPSPCPVSRRRAAAVRSVRRGRRERQHAILSIHRVFTYPGAKKFGTFLAMAPLSRSLLARSPVVKSRDFFLRAVYGNVEGRRGRGRVRV